MNRNEIYDHLANVYLGKRSEADRQRRRKFNAWLVINVLITAVIFTSVFYGLTAFLAQRSSSLRSRIIFSLHNGPLLLEYNFKDSFSPTKAFAISVPTIEIAKYRALQFAIRAREEGTPGIVKVVIKNQKNETASYYVKNVGLAWQEFNIPLEEFKDITDWTDLTDISFVVESWNADHEKGVVLIDNLCFST